MSQYSRGAAFERRVRDYYRNKGWTVFRSAGSHSPADLICLRQGEILLIQCKLSGYVPPAERALFEDLIRDNNCLGIYASRDKNNKLVLEDVH